ncbi:MAG TPA: hypothetical protein VK488_13100 [Gaiellaceae bacterium]|nr:hypothetical protein [Gaiellaceae bacterium]
MALFLLVAAGISLIASVQLTFWARRWLVTPSELTMWYGEASPERREMMRLEQRVSLLRHNRWNDRGRWAYNAGIICLLGAIPFLLEPIGGLGHATFMRRAAFGLAVTSVLAEIIWVLATALFSERWDNFASEQ